MKYFFQTFSFTFLAYMTLWFVWASSIGLPGSQYDGSLVFLPHAARVICTCIFGLYAIPAIILADFIGLEFFTSIPDVSSLSSLGLITFKAFTVYLSLLALKLFGFSFNYSKGEVLLNRTNYRHIGLITILSAFINGVFGNALKQVFEMVDIPLWTIFRYVVGDILGTLVVFAVSVLVMSIYKELVNRL